jgi:hypothetical protein
MLRGVSAVAKTQIVGLTTEVRGHGGYTPKH